MAGMTCDDYYKQWAAIYIDSTEHYKRYSTSKLNKALRKIKTNKEKIHNLAELSFSNSKNNYDHANSIEDIPTPRTEGIRLRAREESRTAYNLLSLLEPIKKHKKALKKEIPKRKKGAFKKREEKTANKEKEELEKREQREQSTLNLELEKQRLAQEHELKKMEMQLQIEETKLLREREERQANRDSIDSLRDSLKDD